VAAPGGATNGDKARPSASLSPIEKIASFAKSAHFNMARGVPVLLQAFPFH